ncbi:hypothetical protein OPV22_020655 [Ensete ventricosum]|uniref:Uncharacterized protein n=1 Tax=Ensete ventricosum TaxID=4639 RepID=A0AAV8QJG4_ENSVE|nr:hypothetical protein OPV22_020655 [Ensete ventricosum]
MRGIGGDPRKKGGRRVVPKLELGKGWDPPPPSIDVVCPPLPSSQGFGVSLLPVKAAAEKEEEEAVTARKDRPLRVSPLLCCSLHVGPPIPCLP